jgi:hypothetical protein
MISSSLRREDVRLAHMDEVTLEASDTRARAVAPPAAVLGVRWQIRSRAPPDHSLLWCLHGSIYGRD